ncbi:SIR2 family protein [Buttiauxella sp. B2]|uniref:SIR2 family protein n=1 Tax=Buttiauxella sp. B2 TaxID=2587812 RepID=UPI00111EEF73|nr:SIR2 family protein [Buttiauxella sp. B2]TNV19701.1 SIR2 family protein [Buttiauxella sp. B2]
MISWPESLISDLARRKCILFLGAGVSMNSVSQDGKKYPPSWKAFLEQCMVDVDNSSQIKKLIANEDYLTACELIKIRLPKGKFQDNVRAAFSTPRYKHAPIHESLFKLDCRIVVTPNFDKIYETYASKETLGTVVVKNYHDNDIVTDIKGDGRVILKIHGTVDNAQKLIFSRSDYAKARSESRDFYELLSALSLTHTFLFVGCGVNDPDIRLLLEDSFFKHYGSKPHFLVTSNKSIHKDMLPVIEDTLNLNILQYKENKGSHGELMDSFDELVTLVDEWRLVVKETLNW